MNFKAHGCISFYIQVSRIIELKCDAIVISSSIVSGEELNKGKGKKYRKNISFPERAELTSGSKVSATYI